MQLTKDDVTTEYEIFKLQAQDKIRPKDIKKLDYSKFQQVVEFYEIYKNNQIKLCENHPSIMKKYKAVINRGCVTIFINYNDWLFNYCFKDGLK